MQAPSFADVLDEVLRRRPADTPVPRAWAAQSQPYRVAPILFGRPLTSPAPRWMAPPAAQPRRARHLLDEAQQAAFDRLAELGATLAADFCADELRYAYRRLAKRYHPDRHAAADAGQRERLTRSFADVGASYRCLRVLVEPRH